MSPRVDLDTYRRLQDSAGADFVKELIDTFLEESKGTFSDLHRALAAGDAELFRRAAHSLKSSANTFGALQLGLVARELEAVGRSNDLAGVGDKLRLAEEEYAAATAELIRLRDGL